MAILPNLQAEIDRLTAENAALKAAASSGGNGLKVSEKGAVSLYGIGRFPVTLYQGQWKAIFAKRDAIEAFIAANASKLSVKD